MNDPCPPPCNPPLEEDEAKGFKFVGKQDAPEKYVTQEQWRELVDWLSSGCDPAKKPRVF